MSLLGTQVYANTDTPMWLSTDGGNINGSLYVADNLDVGGGATIEGNLIIDGTTQSSNAIKTSAGSFQNTDGNYTIQYGTFGGTPTAAYIQSPSNVRFTQINQTTGNTELVLSAPGSGLDSFTTNFLYAIGPVPSIPIPVGANPTVSLPTGSGNRTGTFAITTPYALTSNAVYDVQATGVVTWTGGPAPSAGDLVTVTAEVGSVALSGSSQIYYPGDAPFTWVVNVGENFNIRARLPASGSIPPNPVVQVSFLGAAGTGQIDAVCSYMSIARVG